MSNKSRKKRPPSKPQEVTKPLSPSPWYKKVWVVASAVGAAAFALGLNGPTLLKNIRNFPAEISMTLDQYLSWLKEDVEWTGQWSTYPEGIVNMAEMNLYSEMDIRVSITSKNGDISGEIATEAICKNVLFNFLLIRGKVRGNTARVTAWDVIEGRTISFAELDFSRKDDIITIKPVSGHTAWFPANARIGRHPIIDEKFLAGLCVRKPEKSHLQKKAASNRSL